MESLNYNFFNTLIFSGIVYGFVFSIQIISNKRYRSQAYIFLVFTVLSLTLSNLQYWLIDVGLREKLNIPKVVYIQFELLILPFFYLFVCKYLEKNVDHKLILLTLIPFALGMTYQFYTYFLRIEKPLLTAYNLIVEVATIFYSVLLISLIFLEIHRYGRLEHNNLQKKVLKNTLWLKYSMLCGVSVIVLWIISTQLFYIKGYDSFKTYYPLWIGISIVIYWVGYQGLTELTIVKQREAIRKKKKVQKINPTSINKSHKDKGKHLFEKILNDINTEEAYLDSTLSQQIVANRYNISNGYLSQLINTHSEKSFTKIINELRVEEAKKMLSDETFNQYTIDAIALESGFNTKSNFYSVFKKMTGITPREFKKVQDL